MGFGNLVELEGAGENVEPALFDEFGELEPGRVAYLGSGVRARPAAE